MSGQTPDNIHLELVDTHAHVSFPQFDHDRDRIKAQLESGELSMLIEVGTTVEDSLRAMEVFKGVKNVLLSVGVHPHESDGLDDRGLETLKSLLKDRQVVAVGEIGLDFYRDLSPREVQKSVFLKQLEIAFSFSLPVVVHVRDAYEEVYEILRRFKGLKGVIHAFSGGPAMAGRFLELGYYLGIGGPITYRKNDGLREIVRLTPIEKLISETDCPYLPPVQFRGKRNEPLYVRYVVEEIARQKEMDIYTCSKQLMYNAKELFTPDL